MTSTDVVNYAFAFLIATAGLGLLAYVLWGIKSAFFRRGKP